MATGLSNYAMDEFVGTDVSAFTAADICDMSEYDAQSQHLLSNYILNSMMRGRPASPEFEYRFHFFRRLITAFDEHDLARRETLDFLEARASGEGAGFGAYFKALHHWEQLLMATWHAFNTMGEHAGARVFSKGDGSVYERLHSLYNSAKHGESRIASGQMPTKGPLPVWVTNEGLRNTDLAVTFGELAELLVELATWGFVLEDPVTTKERLEGLIGLENAEKAR